MQLCVDWQIQMQDCIAPAYASLQHPVGPVAWILCIRVWWLMVRASGLVQRGTQPQRVAMCVSTQPGVWYSEVQIPRDKCECPYLCVFQPIAGASSRGPVCAGAVHAGGSAATGGCRQLRVQLPGVLTCAQMVAFSWCKARERLLHYTYVRAGWVRGLYIRMASYCCTLGLLLLTRRWCWTSSCLCARCSWVTCGTRELLGGPSET